SCRLYGGSAKTRSTDLAGRRAIASRQSPSRMSSRGKGLASTIARTVSATGESVNSAAFHSVVGRGERLGFEQRKQIGGPRKREANRLERAAVMRRDAEPADAGEMLGGRIPDIGSPAVTGVALGEAVHDSVARHLGDDRGGSDREAQGVAL